MTKETMNVHKALSELKVLDDRIIHAINDAKLCLANKHSNGKICGVPVEDYKSLMKASYNKVTDLIRRREAIKRAVVLSNAVTKVTVAEKEYTVAEAIEMKSHGLDFKKLLKQQMMKQYNSAMAKINTINESLDESAESYVTGIFGGKESNTSSAKIEETRKLYIEENTMDLVDPISILEKMELLETEISNFTSEVDAALSCSNAITLIEVEY